MSPPRTLWLSFKISAFDGAPQALEHLKYNTRADAVQGADLMHVGFDVPAEAPRETVLATARKAIRDEFAPLDAKDEEERRGLVRQLIIALPRGISEEQQRELVRRYIGDLTKGRARAIVGIHRDSAAKDGLGNPHAHILLIDRQETEHLAKKRAAERARETGKKTRARREYVMQIFTAREGKRAVRRHWRDLANGYLEAVGAPVRLEVDSFRSLGIEREATMHEGPGRAQAAAAGRPYKGKDKPPPERVNERIRRINERAEEVDHLMTEVARLEGENRDLQRALEIDRTQLQRDIEENDAAMERMATERDLAKVRAATAEKAIAGYQQSALDATARANAADAALEPTKRRADDLERAVADIERYLEVELGPDLSVAKRVETLREAAERRRREDAEDSRKEIDQLTTALTAAQDLAEKEAKRADGERKRADAAEALLRRSWDLARRVALALAERVEAMVKGGILALVGKILPQEPEAIRPNVEDGVQKLRKLLAQEGAAEEARTKQPTPPAPRPKLAPAPINVVPLDAEERRLEAAAKMPPRVPETVIVRFANKGEVFGSIEEAELWVHRQVKQHGSIAKYAVEYGRGGGVSKHTDLAAARAERAYRDRPLGLPDIIAVR
ncbi:MobA/MobL family protein [Azospirillum sp. B2RO_4]|uniref:MobA/MobL family protein n=1 Tax=Azospirillum sp. B2RO_4 TaxID=3027796 RepID=UPI003DA9D288